MPSHPSPISDLRLGNDLIEVSRLRKAYARFGQAFFAKMLTPEELRYCFCEPTREVVFLRRAAGKIALKEAVSKALGTGLNGLGWGEGVSWHEMQILSPSKQPPELELTGHAQRVANELNIRTWRLSLSHDGDYAMATVIGLIF